MPQIRVKVSEKNYIEIKKRAKECGLELQTYSGMMISGFIPVKNPLISQEASNKPNNDDGKQQ